MLKTMMKDALWFSVCLVIALSARAQDQIPKYTTQIKLNGVATNVYFNDGDTFKILDGALKNSRVRIAGFNTLETYGPVHQWKNSTASYLFDVANEATNTAQTGSWSCETDGKKDGYGRLLANCDDLAIAMISAGLAHAYSVDNTPATKKYLTAQRTAKSKHLGIWKYGTPDYIITSLHSADEGAESPYNRLISTTDGHTEKWTHNDSYGTCENVCLDGEVSCMLYVPFGQRYGSSKPECLKSGQTAP